MKKLISGFLIGISFMFLISAGLIQTYQVRKNTAEVEKYLEVYVFFANTPVMEYEVLGDIKVNISSQRYNEVKKNIIKKAKKQYPICEGVIIYPGEDSFSSERATAIKFK